jgi:hypothetical protein
MPKPKSKAQAHLFGAVAGGMKTQAKGLGESKAKEMLKGSKLKGLPEYAEKKKAKKKK